MTAVRTKHICDTADEYKWQRALVIVSAALMFIKMKTLKKQYLFLCWEESPDEFRVNSLHVMPLHLRATKDLPISQCPPRDSLHKFQCGQLFLCQSNDNF